MMQSEESINVQDLSLDEWLAMVRNPPNDPAFVNVAFPTDRHRQEYLETIVQRSEEEVINLIFHFLIRSGSLGLFDELKLESLRYSQQNNPEMYERMIRMQYYRRLILSMASPGQVQPWEGITWVLDLLPYSPKLALEGLNAFLLAHIQVLPAWRIHGLFDAAALIRAKFIGIPGSQPEALDFLSNISPREFECLIERLYARMGYITQLTPPRKDGGRDVIVRRDLLGEQEYALVECKRYNEPVGVNIVRSLYGVVSDEKANRGILVTTSRFTEDAAGFAARNHLELIDGEQLIPLLNKLLGPNWAQHLDRLVTESEKEYILSRMASNP